MKKLFLSIFILTFATAVFAGGSIFESKRKERNTNGVESIGMHICGSLKCPPIRIIEGSCSQKENASLHWGVCLCDEGFVSCNNTCCKGTCGKDGSCILPDPIILTTEEKEFLDEMTEINTMLALYEFDGETKLERKLQEIRQFSTELVSAYNNNQSERFHELKDNFDVDEAIEELREAKIELEEEIAELEGAEQQYSFNVGNVVKNIFGIKTAYAGTMEDLTDLVKEGIDAIRRIGAVKCRIEYGGQLEEIYINGKIVSKCCTGAECTCASILAGGVGNHGIIINGKCCTVEYNDEYGDRKRCICQYAYPNDPECQCFLKDGEMRNGVCCKDGQILNKDNKWETDITGKCGCPEGSEEKNGACCQGNYKLTSDGKWEIDTPCCEKKIVKYDGYNYCGCPGGEKKPNLCCIYGKALMPSGRWLDYPECGCSSDGYKSSDEPACCKNGKELNRETNVYDTNSKRCCQADRGFKWISSNDGSICCPTNQTDFVMKDENQQLRCCSNNATFESDKECFCEKNPNDNRCCPKGQDWTGKECCETGKISNNTDGTKLCCDLEKVMTNDYGRKWCCNGNIITVAGKGYTCCNNGHENLSDGKQIKDSPFCGGCVEADQYLSKDGQVCCKNGREVNNSTGAYNVHSERCCMGTTSDYVKFIWDSFLNVCCPVDSSHIIEYTDGTKKCCSRFATFESDKDCYCAKNPTDAKCSDSCPKGQEKVSNGECCDSNKVAESGSTKTCCGSNETVVGDQCCDSGDVVTSDDGTKTCCDDYNSKVCCEHYGQTWENGICCVAVNSSEPEIQSFSTSQNCCDPDNIFKDSDGALSCCWGELVTDIVSGVKTCCDSNKVATSDDGTKTCCGEDEEVVDGKCQKEGNEDECEEDCSTYDRLDSFWPECGICNSKTKECEWVYAEDDENCCKKTGGKFCPAKGDLSSECVENDVCCPADKPTEKSACYSCDNGQWKFVKGLYKNYEECGCPGEGQWNKDTEVCCKDGYRLYYGEYSDVSAQDCGCPDGGTPVGDECCKDGFINYWTDRKEVDYEVCGVCPAGSQPMYNGSEVQCCKGDSVWSRIDQEWFSWASLCGCIGKAGQIVSASDSSVYWPNRGCTYCVTEGDIETYSTTISYYVQYYDPDDRTRYGLSELESEVLSSGSYMWGYMPGHDEKIDNGGVVYRACCDAIGGKINENGYCVEKK